MIFLTPHFAARDTVMKAVKVVDQEELKQRLLEHVQEEAAQLAEDLSESLKGLLRDRDPIKFEHGFADVIRRFGAGLLGKGLQELQPEAKEEIKKGSMS
jgi:soluble cytochrome b562